MGFEEDLNNVIDDNLEGKLGDTSKVMALMVEQGTKKALTEVTPNLAAEIASSTRLYQKPLITDISDENNVYYGYAPIGSSTSAAVWRIEKEITVGDVVTSKFASAGSFTNVWDNHTSLTYS